MANDNQIGLEAIFENADFQRGVNDYNSAVSDASRNTEQAGGRMSEVWDGLANVGAAAIGVIAAAISTAIVAVSAFGLATWNAGQQIDSAMDTIQIATGATGETLAGLRVDFETVFQSVPASADAVAGVIGELNTRLGVTGEGLSDLSIQLLQLTELAGGDATERARLFPRVMGDWGIAVDDASGSLDKFFVASQLTGAGVDKLMQQVVQFGAPLRLMGFNLDESIALFGKWEKEGVNAELVMGSLRIAAGKFADAGKPLRDSLLETFDSIKNNTDASEALALAMDVFGARAGPDMAAAIREGRFEIDDLVAALGDADGAIAKTADATFDFGEKLEIFKNRLTTRLAPLGEILLSSLTAAMDSVMGLLDLPEVQAALDTLAGWFEILGEHIRDFAVGVIEDIPNIIAAIQGIPDWFRENQPLIVGILAALGVAIAAFAWTVISSMAAAVVAMAPILLAMALIGVGAALLYTAWTENWGGIQEHTAALWAWLQPILTNLIEWFQVNIPVALQYLSDLWSNTLLPAIQAVWEWISTNLIPLFVMVVQWLQVNVPAAITALSEFWTNTLLPAIQAVWGWISTNLIPLFQALSELLNVALSLAVTALAGLWQNILLPAIQAVGSWISGTLLPTFKNLSDTIRTNVMPVLKPLADFIGKTLVKAFDAITAVIQKLIALVGKLTAALSSITLPPALTPGSPTPFEIGLKGINKELSKLSKSALPAVRHEMNVLATVRDVPGVSAASTGRMVSTSNSVANYFFGAQFNVNNSNTLTDILRGLS